MIKLAALAAGDWAEQRTAEYRISNRRITKGGIALLSLFYKIDRIHYSMLDVQCSMFDVHQFLFRLDRPFFWPAAGLTPETMYPYIGIKPG
jgi:hypothetical protein